MRYLSARKARLIAGLALVGTLAWAGQAITVPQALGSAKSVVPPVVSTLPVSDFTEVAEAVAPAVVNITREAVPVSESDRDLRHRFRDRNDWEEGMEKFYESPRRGPMPRGPHGRFGPWGPPGPGMGSGVIVSPDGYVVTNHHVVEGAREVTVTLPDKREFTGKIVGTDPKTDLAVVKVPARELPYVRWGDSSQLRVGEPVLAVGTPFGLTSTVTQGIVSAVGRARVGITEYEDFIQTDAAINPGNSGGALVNRRGELVGINTAIVSRTGGYQGIGFAIPTSMAKPIYKSLVSTGTVVRGYLGVGIQDVTQDLAESFKLTEPKGALVGDVKAGGPADRGGIRRGDVVTAYRGEPVGDPVVLQRLVTQTPVGTDSTMTVVRDGKEMDLTVTIGQHPDSVKVARPSDERRSPALAGLALKELDKSTARRLGLGEEAEGVLVVKVTPGSSADRAGLTKGDVIREVNHQAVNSVHDFERIASDLEQNERVLLLVNRRGASLFLSVKV